MRNVALLCAAFLAATPFFVSGADVADQGVRLKAHGLSRKISGVPLKSPNKPWGEKDSRKGKAQDEPVLGEVKHQGQGVPGTAQTNGTESQGPANDVKEDRFDDPPMPLEEYHPDTSKVIQLSSRPRAFLFPDFLSAQECDYIVNYSRPRVKRSTVVSQDGKGAIDNIRTSHGSSFEKWENPVIRRIEERLAAWTHLPVDFQEPMQVLKYVDGQKYGSHYDYSEGQANLTGGQRYCTVLMYLSDVEHGGETVFPNSEQDPTVKDETWSDCGKQGVAVKPRKGAALLFFSMRPDGSFDATSLHSGCPVLKGEKWSATKWIHTRDYGAPYRDPDVCQDDHDQCSDWASMGECEKNSRFMKGIGRKQHELGFCRKSCGVCT